METSPGDKGEISLAVSQESLSFLHVLLLYKAENVQDLGSRNVNVSLQALLPKIGAMT